MGPNGGQMVAVEELQPGDHAFLDHALRMVQRLEDGRQGPIVADTDGRHHYFPSGLRVERIRRGESDA